MVVQLAVARILRLVSAALRPKPQRGATAVEYALMAGLIAVAIVGAVTLFGGAVSDLYADADLLDAILP